MLQLKIYFIELYKPLFWLLTCIYPDNYILSYLSLLSAKDKDCAS
jgi:hypothetical protein